MLAIFKREMRSYFTGVIGYVFLVLFLAIGELLFKLWGFDVVYNVIY